MASSMAIHGEGAWDTIRSATSSATRVATSATSRSRSSLNAGLVAVECGSLRHIALTDKRVRLVVARVDCRHSLLPRLTPASTRARLHGRRLSGACVAAEAADDAIPHCRCSRRLAAIRSRSDEFLRTAGATVRAVEDEPRLRPSTGFDGLFMAP